MTRFVVLLIGLTLASCSGVHVDSGLDAAIDVIDGDFRRGALPIESGGPHILGAYLVQTTLRVEQQNKAFSGVANGEATSVFVALEGDIGYFQVPVGYPPPESPDGVGFDANFSLTNAVRPGTHTILTWAVDAAGRVGPPARSEFLVLAHPPPDGSLVVTLDWEGHGDLDLRLILPDGVEISASDPIYSVEGVEFARLDFDSNAECSFDGRNRENVIFSGGMPRGEFRVLVATSSLCGDSANPFELLVSQHGSVFEHVEGTSLPSDTRYGGGRGAGVLATTFEVQ